MTNKTKLDLQWDSYSFLIDTICTTLQRNYEKELKAKNTLISGIARGGLIPAVHLSHKLNIPFLSVPYNTPDNSTLILVDDVIDTGDTLRTIGVLEKATQHYTFNYNSNIRIILVALAVTTDRELGYGYKPCARGMVIPKDDKGQNIWVVFPWETETSTER